MIRRPPRSTLDRSSAASDVYKRQGHASFLAQWSDLNVLIDPNFANWLFLLKRLKHAGLKVEHLPQIDLVLISHAHYDHFHKPSIRKLPGRSRIAVVPQGMAELAE